MGALHNSGGTLTSCTLSNNSADGVRVGSAFAIGEVDFGVGGIVGSEGEVVADFLLPGSELPWLEGDV